MITTIIFDAFGTLISTGNSSVDAVTKILELHERDDITPSDFYALFKMFHRNNIINKNEFITEAHSFYLALKETYNYYKINGSAESDIEIMLSILGKRALFEDTKITIDTLSKEYTVCIGSNTDTSPLIENLKRNNLAINKIYTSESLHIYKPNPIFYQSILKDLKILPSEALFVGDSLLDDVSGPQSIGIISCHLNRNGYTYRDIKPEFSITSLNELPALIQQLNNLNRVGG